MLHIRSAGLLHIFESDIQTGYFISDSNIVNTVYVGDVKAPLLLTCPFRKDPNSNVNQLEFLNPTFTKLNRSTIRQIDIEIYDDAGALVPFLYGRTLLTLEFRKR